MNWTDEIGKYMSVSDEIKRVGTDMIFSLKFSHKLKLVSIEYNINKSINSVSIDVHYS